MVSISDREGARDVHMIGEEPLGVFPLGSRQERGVE